MADPMWTGGAQQFQDRYPYVWFIMGDWAKAPFYPTDPPRTPGAFYDSVAPIMDFPALGTAYSPFISQYALYYDEQWTLNPPGTSTTTSNPPSSDEDTSLAAKVDTLALQVAALHTKVGTLVETDTLASLAYYIASRVGSGEDPPPLASTLDTARILAALYYVAQAVIVPAWSIDNSEVLAAVEAAKDELAGEHTNLGTSIANLGTAVSGGFATTDAKVDDVRGVETDILNAIGEIPTTGGGSGNLYPGNLAVTWGTPIPITGPSLVEVAMDGCMVVVEQIPSGQSVQTAGGVTRYEGLAWLAFKSDTAGREARQSVELSSGLYKPMTLLTASGLSVYCKSGCELTITPYTINVA